MAIAKSSVTHSPSPLPTPHSPLPSWLYAVFGLANFGVSHEPAPDVSAAQVLGAEQGNANINADHVGIDPAGGRVESVGETITAINLLPEFLFHLAQGGQCDVRREHQRPARRAGPDRPVNRPL